VTRYRETTHGVELFERASGEYEFSRSGVAAARKNCDGGGGWNAAMKTAVFSAPDKVGRNGMTFEPDWAQQDMDEHVGICSRNGCGRALTRVHDATGIDAEGRVGPLWTCKDHRIELWMKVSDGLVAPLEWWPD